MTSLMASKSIAIRGETIRKVASFGAIGLVSTAAYVAIYSCLRGFMPAGAANALGLVATAVGNTAANRRLTFRVRGRDGIARDQLAGLVALSAAMAITSTALIALNAVAPHHGRTTELAVLVGSNAAATLVRFLLLRIAIDRRALTPLPAAKSMVTFNDSERTRG